MYIQWCLKGIAGPTRPGATDGVTWNHAQAMVLGGHGLISNWWHHHQNISPEMISAVLTDTNLERHLHDYGAFRDETPFISLTAGAVDRDRFLSTNHIHSAVDTALGFATRGWRVAGAVFYCWTPVALNKAVAINGVAEAVGDIRTYRSWSPFHLEGEITAKVSLPANQIQRVEWWTPADAHAPMYTCWNPDFCDPLPVVTMRRHF